MPQEYMRNDLVRRCVLSPPQISTMKEIVDMFYKAAIHSKARVSAWMPPDDS